MHGASSHKPGVCGEQTRGKISLLQSMFKRKKREGVNQTNLKCASFFCKKKKKKKNNRVQSHRIHSPYIFGLSPRMYASNVRLRTAAQSRSRLSFSTLSSSSSSSGNVAVVLVLAASLRVPWLVAALAASSFLCFSLRRAAREESSPALNLGPRSGQLRAGSNGFHLWMRIV